MKLGDKILSIGEGHLDRLGDVSGGGAGGIEEKLDVAAAVGGNFVRELLDGGATAEGIDVDDFDGFVGVVGEEKGDPDVLVGADRAEFQVGIGKLNRTRVRGKETTAPGGEQAGEERAEFHAMTTVLLLPENQRDCSKEYFWSYGRQ